jgi:hypothetical protein
MVPGGARLFNSDGSKLEGPITNHAKHPNLIITTIRAEVWSASFQGELCERLRAGVQHR